MRPDGATFDQLLEAARGARANAHAPYSRFRVGAALLSGDGEVYVGANVENAAYPCGICAEHSAVAAAIVAGQRDLVAIAIVTGGAGSPMPCGKCRQVLNEFNPTMWIVSENEAGQREEARLDALLPGGFGRPDLDDLHEG